MRSASAVLPPAVSTPRISARLWLVLAAAVGAGVCGYAGLYPRFDDGKLRLVLALTCAPFAAAVTAASLGAKSAEGAMARAVALSALLGMAAVVLPAAMLTGHGSGEFFAACVFGGFLGAIVGALYGLPLGILCAGGWRNARTGTQVTTDRAARLAGGWLVMISLVGLLGTLLLDQEKWDWEGRLVAASSTSAWMLAAGGALAGVFMVVHALVRARRRASWVVRVRAGLEPTFRVRALDARDEVEGLPRIGEGESAEVVEWCPDDAAHAPSGAAYRAAAYGKAVAVVR